MGSSQLPSTTANYGQRRCPAIDWPLPPTLHMAVPPALHVLHGGNAGYKSQDFLQPLGSEHATLELPCRPTHSLCGLSEQDWKWGHCANDRTLLSVHRAKSGELVRLAMTVADLSHLPWENRSLEVLSSQTNNLRSWTSYSRTSLKAIAQDRTIFSNCKKRFFLLGRKFLLL